MNAKTPTVSGRCHFYSYFQNPSESSEIKSVRACFSNKMVLLYIIHTLNVTTSGRNCNTIFDVLTSKIPNADRSKHAFVCVCVGGGILF